MKLIRTMMICSIAALAGCMQDRAPENKTVKIGVILPRTGQFGEYGGKVIDGIKFFVDAENRAGGIGGKKIELIVIDNGSDPQKTVKAFLTLAETHKVPVVIGAYSSANTLLLKPDALKYGIPVVTPTATNDQVTVRNPYMFRTCFNDTYQGLAVGRYAAREMKINRVGVVLNIDEDGDYSKGLARAMEAAFESAGGVIVREEGYYRGEKSYAGLLRRLISTKIKAIFIPGYPPEVPLMIVEARKSGFAGILFGGDGWDEPEVAKITGGLAENCFFSSMFSSEFDNPRTKSFVEKFRQAFNRSPGMCEAQGCDTAAVVVAALRSASASGRSVRAALYKTTGFPGVTGPISIDARRNAVKNVFIKHYVKTAEGGCEARLRTVITPAMMKGWEQ